LFFRAEDAAQSFSFRARDVLVEDVWILAGQSNMNGYGDLDLRLEPHPQVRALYMDDRWEVAQDPIQDVFTATDPIHGKLIQERQLVQGPGTGTGPGVSFGRKMAERSGVSQGLIACAHGGSYLGDWNPHPESGASLYLAMLRRVRGNGGRIAGVFWYQVCSDAKEGKTGDYSEKMIEMIEAMRSNLGDSKLPVVIAQIARFHWNCPIKEPEVCSNLAESWTSIREQQRLLAESIPHTRLVTTVDLDQEDFIHLSAQGQHRLGRRFATS
jgi:sialate O-acetylesterase